jgi:hypothetical protein
MITHHVASRIEGRPRAPTFDNDNREGREGLEGRDPTSAIYVFSPARVIYVYGKVFKLEFIYCGYDFTTFATLTTQACVLRPIDHGG